MRSPHTMHIHLIIQSMNDPQVSLIKKILPVMTRNHPISFSATLPFQDFLQISSEPKIEERHFDYQVVFLLVILGKILKVSFKMSTYYFHFRVTEQIKKNSLF